VKKYRMNGREGNTGFGIRSEVSISAGAVAISMTMGHFGGVYGSYGRGRVTASIGMGEGYRAKGRGNSR
jgi:hypothetical protein